MRYQQNIGYEVVTCGTVFWNTPDQEPLGFSWLRSQRALASLGPGKKQGVGCCALVLSTSQRTVKATQRAGVPVRCKAGEAKQSVPTLVLDGSAIQGAMSSTPSSTLRMWPKLQVGKEARCCWYMQ